MALLNFPAAPFNGELYPVTPLVGQNQYIWEAATSTWRLIGSATGVSSGVYGSSLLVPQVTIDDQGRVTAAANVAIQLGNTTQVGLVQLVDNTLVNDSAKALTAAQGSYLQTQIGNTTLLNPAAADLVTAVNGATAPSGVTIGTYGDSTTVGQFTVDSQGRVTLANDVPIPLATAASVGLVSAGANIAVDGLGELSVSTASVTTVGVTQLEDSTTSTSTVTAATPNSVKSAYDLAAAAVPLSGGVLTGDLTFSVTQVFPGMVTSITAGTGLNGGTITSTGTIDLADTAVVPATYGSATAVPQLVVDQQGRLTSVVDLPISFPSSVPTVTAPTVSTDPGSLGEVAQDSTYFYFYDGIRWQRIAWDSTAW